MVINKNKAISFLKNFVKQKGIAKYPQVLNQPG